MCMEAKFERFKEWLSSKEMVVSRENSFQLFGREMKEKKDKGEEQEARVRIFAKKSGKLHDWSQGKKTI